MKRHLLFLFTLVFLTLPCVAWGATYYASPTGSGTTCSEGSPCTLQYTVETKATSGDTIQLADGTYSETSEVDVPLGVSLIGNTGNVAAVKIQPGADLANLIDFYYATPGGSGANTQTISYVTLDGTNGEYTANIGIRIANVNGLTIDHCVIQNFTGANGRFGIYGSSTQVAFNDSWWTYWPADAGVPGDDSSIVALWPTNPVTGLTISNNIITDCGWWAAGTTIRYPSVRVFQIKDSFIFGNTVDSTGMGTNSTRPFSSTCGWWDNVQFYNNSVSMNTRTEASSYAVEVWLHKGGNVFHNNRLAGGAFSITVGKETQIYDNLVVFNPESSSVRANIGIEFNVQTYGKIYRNRVIGAGYGMVVGQDEVNDGKSFVIKYTTVFNNIVHRSYYEGIRINAREDGSTAPAVSYITVTNNIFDGVRGSSAGGIRIYQLGSSTLDNILIQNNILTNNTYYAGLYMVDVPANVTNVTVNKNIMYGNGTNDWYGFADTNPVVQDPLFTTYASDVFTLSEGSPAIDSGVDAGEDYNTALNSTTDWTSDPLVVGLLSQDLNGSSWEIGPYVYTDSASDVTGPSLSAMSPATGTQLTAGTTSTAASITATDDTGVAGCKWDTTDTTYALMANTMSHAGSGVYTSTFGSLENDTTYVRYGACADTVATANITYFSWNFSVEADTVEDGPVIDNTDTGFSSNGTWYSAMRSDAYGGEHLYEGTSGANSADTWGKWTASAALLSSTAGTYEIFVWVFSGGRPDAAPVEVSGTGGETATTINLYAETAQWRSIGLYALDADGTDYVKITAEDEGYTFLDAVKFVLIEAAVPTTYTFRPTSDASGWTCSDGIVRYAMVDEEISDGDATYVYRGEGAASVYLGGLPSGLPAGTVEWIRVYFTGKEIGGDTYINVGLTVNGTSYYVSNQNMTTSYAEYYKEWATNPDTSSAWLVADLEGTGDNPLQIIRYATSPPAGVTVRMTQTYWVVSYSALATTVPVPVSATATAGTVTDTGAHPMTLVWDNEPYIACTGVETPYFISNVFNPAINDYYRYFYTEKSTTSSTWSATLGYGARTPASTQLDFKTGETTIQLPSGCTIKGPGGDDATLTGLDALDPANETYVNIPFPAGSDLVIDTDTGSFATMTAFKAAASILAGDHFSLGSVTEPGALDMSGDDCTAEAPCVITGTGAVWTGNVTYGDYWETYFVKHASDIILATGNVHSYSLIPTGSTLQIPENATGVSIINDTIAGTLVVSETCAVMKNLIVVAVNAAGLGAGETATFTNCVFVQSQAVIEATGGGGSFAFPGCLFEQDPLFINAGGDDYRIKGTSPCRNAGLIGGSVTNDNMRINVVDGSAFVDFSSAGVFDQYIGGKIIVIDSSGDKLTGYIKAAGTAETYGDELFTDPSFDAVSKAAAKNVTGITKANPGVITFATEHGYVNGDIIYFSGLTEMTELNTEYWQLRSNAGDTFELATVYDTTSLDTSGYGSAETTGGACAQKVTFTNWTPAYPTWVVGVDGAGTLTNKAVNVGSGANQTLYQSVTSTDDALHKLVTTCDALTAGTYAGYIVANYLAIDATSDTGAKNWYGTFSSATKNNGITARTDLAASFTDISIKKVLTPSATGVTIVSEYGGSTYNWTSKDANFNYNDSGDYTYKIYPLLDLESRRIVDELDVGAYEYQPPIVFGN